MKENEMHDMRDTVTIDERPTGPCRKYRLGRVCNLESEKEEGLWQ